MKTININVSEMTVDNLLKIISDFDANKMLKSTHGINISLPGIISTDERPSIDLEQSWGKRNLDKWRNNWIKKWGDNEFTINLNNGVNWFNRVKPINEKYDEWKNEYRKSKASFYDKLNYKGD